jgi:hypothetical protein
MQLHRSVHAIAVVALAGALITPNAATEVPRATLPQQETLQSVLDRIHTLAAGDAWKQEGFRDETIEKWVEVVVSKVAKAAEMPELKLPVRMADVKPVPEVPGRRIQSGLVVGKNITKEFAGSLQDSIVLADGNVEIESVRGSLVIARGAVTVRGTSAYSIIISGAYIRIGMYDGDRRDRAKGSLLVSRGLAQIDAGYGTLMAAPGGARYGLGGATLTDGVLINTAPLAVPPRAPGVIRPTFKSVQIPDLPLEALPVNPLSARIDIVGILNAQNAALRLAGILPPRLASEPIGAVFRLGGRRYVAELDQPIVDESGVEVEDLRGWKLSFVEPELVIFSTADADAVVRIEPKQP